MEGVFKDVMVLWVLAEEYSTWIFLGDDFWIYFRVQLFPWFDSGYMLRQSTAAFVCGAFRIQRNAWFDTGYIQSGTLLSCGGEGFSPDDAYGSSLDSVMPMKGKHTINYLQYHEYGFGRPSLEREVQLDFRVHSSSCGAHCDVVHSPFEWFYHRRHCNCRDLVLFVGRLP